MAARVLRRNQSLLDWIKALFVASITAVALVSMEFRPEWGAYLLAVAAGLLTVVAVDLGVLTTLLALTAPVMAADPVVGILMLVLSVVGMRYLGTDGGRVFIILAIAVFGAFTGPAFAAAAIAGYLLGASEGALAAGIACATTQAVGVLIGRETLTAVVTGGSSATRLLVFDPTRVPASLFSSEWLRDIFSEFSASSVERVITGVSAINHPAALAVQPFLWAAAAIITGTLVRSARARGATAGGIMPAVAGALGVLVPGAGAAVIAATLGIALPPSTVVIATVSSALLAGAFVGVAERFFPLQPALSASTSAPRSMAAEDADVDELLRLISTAEEKLATRHATVKVVMITDMKSFSRMTEEDGSVLTAKAIQRHRDLLIPIIEKHGGHGKSTGGDGLVAAFDNASDAVAAAAEMQRALDAHNAAHPDVRPLYVRIGVADGEVVLDKHGRPFIGAALNLAARVMSLADGGQAFVTSTVADKAPGIVPVVSHGEFELKNISRPVTVMELLWAEGQVAQDPRARGSSPWAE